MKATGCKKIYNAENIIEAEMLVEMLKENGIAAFTQEPSSSVAAYGVAGFGVYGVDIWAEADEAEKAVQIIEEIENLWIQRMRNKRIERNTESLPLAASPENMTMKIRAVLITMIISTALGSISSLKFPYDRYAITIQ